MPSTPEKNPDASRWLSKLHRNAGAPAILALVLPLLSGALLVLQAASLANLLHEAISEDAKLEVLFPGIVLIAALIAIRAGLGFVSELASAYASESLKLRLRKTLFFEMLNKGPLWTARQSSGALSTTLLQQVDALDGFFVRYMPAMIQASVLPVAFAAVVFSIDWVVGLLFLVTAPLIPVFMALAGWGAEAASRSQAMALSRLTGRFADRLRGVVTLKLFGRGQSEVEEVHAASEDLRLRSMRVMRIAFMSSAVLEFFAALGVAGVALYVGLTFLDLITLREDGLTLQAGLFCLLMAPEVYQPLRLLAAHYHDRASAKAAAHEIASQLGSLPELNSSPGEPFKGQGTLPYGALTLTARNLGVLSPEGRPIISGANFEFSAGARISILGFSGIGKSTLLEAIARLRPFSGTLEVGGIGIDDVGEADLRSRVVMLGQRPRIFAGTIADNIRLGRSGACDTAVRLAAQRALVTEFTDSLPDRLDTKIGENGLGLSGGEIQRVALARIYLRNPGLILLDEPTAHLDPETESDVLDGLLDFARGRTLIIVTHSHAVAQRTDHVYRVTAGLLLPAPKPARVKPTAKRGAA